MGLFQHIRAKILDQNAQPIVTAFRQGAVADRKIDELVGLIKGVLADGHVHQAEAAFMLNWMNANRDAAAAWPASVLYPRLAAAMADGHLSNDEEGELLGLLASAVGANTTEQGHASGSTSLPLDRPAPPIAFDGRVFCFTGQFYSGSRRWCEEAVTARGAQHGTLTKKTHFLVIGEIGSRDWAHSTHGRKIEKAIAMRESGAPVAIVSEEHWTKHL
jgi:NAD-dependent DNA ligase